MIEGFVGYLRFQARFLQPHDLFRCFPGTKWARVESADGGKIRARYLEPNDPQGYLRGDFLEISGGSLVHMIWTPDLEARVAIM